MENNLRNLLVRGSLCPIVHTIMHTIMRTSVRTTINRRAHPLLLLFITLRPLLLLKVIQLLASSILLPQDIPLEPPRQRLRKLVIHVSPRRHAKDVVQLFERTLFRLGQPEEYHDEGEGVHACVKAECTSDAERAQLSRESQRDDGGPEVVGRDGPGHADLTMGKREDFCGVGKWHGALSGRVEGAVDVDEEGDEADVGVVGGADEVAEAGGEEGPAHVGEGEEEEAAAAKSVNCPLGRGSVSGEIEVCGVGDWENRVLGELTTAGQANRKLIIPKPKEAKSAPTLVAPAALKMVEE